MEWGYTMEGGTGHKGFYVILHFRVTSHVLLFLITTRQVCPYLILMKQFDSFMLTQLTTHGGMYYDFRSLPTTLVLLVVPTKSFTFYPFQVQAMDDFLP